MNDQTPKLSALGDRLERAVAADLAARPRRRHRRTLLAVVALLTVASAGAAIASSFAGGEEVSRSMTAGAFILQGTRPACTVVKPNVEFHCVLERPPLHEVDDFTGVVYQTVDATQHVNGGCRSLRADGLVWQCYLGQAAVEQRIISADFLGEVQTTPAVG
jgi:hypothetical protein